MGFINKLPHNLIDAFKSTLEEAKYADILLHVLDGSDPDVTSHKDVVYETLRDLDITGKPILTIFNKMDLAGSDVILRDDNADVTLKTSFKTGMGVELLLEKLGDLLLKDQQYIDIMLPYSKTDKLSVIRSRGRIIKEEYLPEGIAVKAYVPISIRI